MEGQPAMQIELNPNLEALLQSQVDAGLYASIAEAITAAVLGVPLANERPGGLAWAKPYLDEADGPSSLGQTHDESDAFADLEGRFGPI